MSRQSDTPVESMTLDECLTERAQLVDEMKDIQAQLGDRNRTTKEGDRLEGEAYWTWRRGAVFALRCREKRMTALKEQIRKLRDAETVSLAGVKDLSDLGLLKAAYQMLRNLGSELEDGFDPEEQALMDVIRNRLTTGKAAA